MSLVLFRKIIGWSMGRFVQALKPPRSRGNPLECAPPGSLKSTPSAAHFSDATTPTCPTSATSTESSMDRQSTFLLEEPLASHSLLPDSEKAWMMLVATSQCDMSKLFANCDQDGSSGKTSLESCQRTEEGRLEPSSGRWKNSGMGGPIECWTAQVGESHSGAAACSLSDILETVDPHSPLYLTNEQCGKMAARLKKYSKSVWPELMAGQETRHPSEQGESCPPSEPSKEGKGSESLTDGSAE